MPKLQTHSEAEIAAAIALSAKGCTCEPIEIARLSAALCRTNNSDTLPQAAQRLLTRLGLSATYGAGVLTLRDATHRALASVRTVTRRTVTDGAPRVRPAPPYSLQRGAPVR